MTGETLRPGVIGRLETSVSPADTAEAVGSGGLPVFATPAMIALMERCAAESVAPYLEAGQSTVGARLDVRHLSATPLGMRVRCETELIGVDRRRLVFSCRAFDDAGLIGEGTQERFIVENARFMEKTEAKRRGNRE